MNTINLASSRIGAVVLAAGRSSRMGERHKLRLPLPDGRTVLQHAVAGALELQPLQLVVVTQPGMEALLDDFTANELDVVANPHYASGMASSLRVGIGALRPDVAAVMVLLGDEPLVANEVIAALLAAYEGEGQLITIPIYGEVPGPPALFRRSVFPELLTLEGDEGGRPVVRRDPKRVAKVQLAAELMPMDIDTPADYERYLAAFRKLD